MTSYPYFIFTKFKSKRKCKEKVKFRIRTQTKLQFLFQKKNCNKNTIFVSKKKHRTKLVHHWLGVFLRIYGCGSLGALLFGIKTMFQNVNACVLIVARVSVSFEIRIINFEKQLNHAFVVGREAINTK